MLFQPSGRGCAPKRRGCRWWQADYNDFLYPTTQGKRDMFTAEETRYRMEIQIAASRDAELRKLSNEVGHLLPAVRNA